MSKKETRPYIYYSAQLHEIFTSDVAPPKNKTNVKLSLVWTFPGDKKPIIELKHVYYVGEL